MRSNCFERKAERHAKIHALRNEGKSYKEIGEATGLGSVTIWKALKTESVVVPPRRLKSLEQLRIAKEMKIAGATYQEIADKLEISTASANAILHAGAFPENDGICQKCGKQSDAIVRHTEDYETGEVILICRSCHMKHFHPEGLNKMKEARADKRVDQKVAILEFCGWKELKVSVRANGRRNIVGLPPEGGKPIEAPNPLKDLNAIHEAEKSLDVNQLSVYADHLDKICVPTHICALTHWQSVTMATAPQRSEAFLKTIGKWEEGTKV